MAYQLTPARNRKFLLVLWVCLYASFTLLVPPFMDGPDALNAEVAREMVVHHDVITPYANGVPLPHPAPMVYWSIAVSMKLFGPGMIPARFALALFALLLFVMTEHVARRAFRSVRAGAYASILLLLSFGTFVFTRILIPETIASLWLVVALYVFWQTEQQGDRPGYLQALALGAACALTTLSIGPVGVLLPVAIVLLYLLLTRGVVGSLLRLRQLHLITELVALLIVAAPWYYAVDQANAKRGLPSISSVHGKAWLGYLMAELQLWQGHPSPWMWCSALLLLVWMLPWSVFLFTAMQNVPWRVFLLRRDALTTEQRTLLLFSSAALVSLLFFSITGHHAYAVLPCMPFIALLLGRWLDREASEVEAETVPSTLGAAGQRLSTVLLACSGVVATAFVLLPLRAYAAFFSRALGWNAVPVADLRGPMQFMAAAFVAGALAAWWLRKNYRPHHANLALAVATVIVLLATHKGLQALTPVLSSQRLAQTMQDKLKADDLIVVNGNYQDASSLAFYLQRENLHVWHSSDTTLPTRLVETDQTMTMRWHGVQRVYVWTDTGALPPLPGKVYVIAESGSKQIVSNRDTVY